MGAEQGGQLAGHPVQDGGLPRGLLPLRLLDLLPVEEDLLRRVRLHAAEHVGVAADQLLVDRPQDVGHGEQAGLLRHAGVEDHLERDVPQLLAELVGGPFVDGLQHLVGLLDEVGLDALVRLLPVPGAAVPSPRSRAMMRISSPNRSRASSSTSRSLPLPAVVCLPSVPRTLGGGGPVVASRIPRGPPLPLKPARAVGTLQRRRGRVRPAAPVPPISSSGARGRAAAAVRSPPHPGGSAMDPLRHAADAQEAPGIAHHPRLGPQHPPPPSTGPCGRS